MVTADQNVHAGQVAAFLDNLIEGAALSQEEQSGLQKIRLAAGERPGDEVLRVRVEIDEDGGYIFSIGPAKPVEAPAPEEEVAVTEGEAAPERAESAQEGQGAPEPPTPDPSVTNGQESGQDAITQSPNEEGAPDGATESAPGDATQPE